MRTRSNDSLRFTCCGLGKRIRKIEKPHGENPDTTSYAYDGMYAVCEFESIEVQYSDYTDKKADYADDGNSLDSEYSAKYLDLQAKYVYANGMLLARYDNSPADTHYYHHDGLGSTVGMTNENANVEQSYFYDDFGESLGSWGSVSNHYLYTGQEYDGAISGLYNLRARYYDSGVGRFVSEDPMLQLGLQSNAGCINCANVLSVASNVGSLLDLNAYIYVQNNPINRMDPLGLRVLKECDLADIIEEMGLITTAFHECCTWTWPTEIDCVEKTMQILKCMQPKLEDKLGCCSYGWGFIPIPYHWGVAVDCVDCEGYRYNKLFESWFCIELY
ncbi:MAG: RHS repeat-associated core domain-containing protein [bacterium]